MDAIEREFRIQQLQRENAASHEYIRQREEERERNPYSVQATLLADARITKDATDLHLSDPIGEPLMRKTDEPATIIYRRYENPSAPAAPDDGEPSDGDDEFTAAFERFADAIENRLADDDRLIAELRAENVEIKGLLGDAVAKVGKLEAKIETLTALFGQKPKLWTP